MRTHLTTTPNCDRMFQQLMIRTRGTMSAEVQTPPDGKKAAHLIGLLEQSPRSTAALAEAAGLTIRQVWGLLKYHRARGTVSFDPDSGIWQTKNAPERAAIQRAAALLRANGWTLKEPQ